MFDREKMKRYIQMKMAKDNATEDLFERLDNTRLLDGSIVYEIEEQEEYRQFENELFKTWFPELDKVWQERQWNEGDTVYKYYYKELVDNFCGAMVEYEDTHEWRNRGDIALTADRVSIDEWIDLLEQEVG